MNCIHFFSSKILRICCTILFLGGIVNNFFAQNSDNSTKSFAESPVKYVSSNFENATPLFWELNPDGSVLVHLVYDHERNTPNRASNHVHFQIQAKPNSDVTLVIQYFDEVWNARIATSHSLLKNYYISHDGVSWTTVPVEIFENGHKIHVRVQSSGVFYVSGMEPYRISDLDKLLNEIRNKPSVEIEPIGKTVEGRQLEIVRIGKPTAPFRVFIRARAHPWEAGGNWLVQGMIKYLLDKNTDKKYLDRYCVYILPMAAKDGVARGLTRFNSFGIDLNRGMNLPADPYLTPENHALEAWLKKMIDREMRPNVSIDLHNDRNGKLSFGHPSNINKPDYNTDKVNSTFQEGYLIMDKNADVKQYESNIAKFESLMYKYTWYTWTQGGVRKDASNSGNYSTRRYHVDIAGLLELNQTWIERLNKAPFGSDWELMGKQMCDVFYHYFDDAGSKK